MKLEKELLDDLERSINEQLDLGKNCGGLRKSDSHEARLRYLYQFWKWAAQGGIERDRAARELEREQLKAELRKEIAKELRDKADSIERDDKDESGK